MSAQVQPARISILPGPLVNQIAAGEVIERPASVVKELVENCIDAGASRIDIEIEDGGTGAIIIRDNGAGIHPDDIELAVMRHTTSKLRSREDLDAITTLGFRGEALSSIASVSMFSIVSRIANADQARRLRVDPATGMIDLGPAAHPVGTCIEVRNLFYNVPARRRFLRSERTEFLHILEIIRHMIMARPDIHINLRHNGRLILNCAAVEADYCARLQAVMGGNFLPQSRPIDVHAGPMHLHGWLGDPDTARSQSDRQYLYLNHRIIRDRQISHAIRMAVGSEFPEARYPAYVLYLQMDPSLVDVNVHPTKQEVRFRQPREVHDFVFSALRSNGASIHQQPGTGGSASGRPSMRSMSGPGYRLQEQKASYQPVTAANETVGPAANPFGRPVAVIGQDHIVAIHAGMLRVIDFARLRDRYLRSRLQRDYDAGSVTSRPLLVPVIFTRTASDLDVLSTAYESLAQLGLLIEPSGPQSVIIRSLPALLPDLELEPLLADLMILLRAPRVETAQIQQVIPLLVRHAGQLSLERATLQQIAEQLCRFATDGMPVNDTDRDGCWYTFSTQALQSLLKNER